MRGRLWLISRLPAQVCCSIVGIRGGEAIGAPPEQWPVARRLERGLIDQDAHTEFAPPGDRGADPSAERRCK